MKNIFIRLLLSIFLVTAVTGCYVNKPVVIPLKSNHYISGDVQAPMLIVLLPGIHDAPGKFQENNFISEAYSKGLAADFVAVDSHIGYFETHTIVERLRTDIILPARKAGYQKIWLVGISLGGFRCSFVYNPAC